MALSDPDPTDPLSTPSHAALHVATNSAIEVLQSKVSTIEAAVPTTAANIEQARRVSNTWIIRDEVEVSVGAPVLPLLWNLTVRAVKYEAAKLSVLTPPTGSGIIVEFQVGNQADPNDITAGAIATLTIPAGQYFSETIDTSGFVTAMQDPDSFVQVVVTQVGSSTPGAGLTVQLNRLL